VVVPDRLGPVSQPHAERLDERFAVQRMELQLLPLLVRRLAGLVQDLRAYLELSDVVEKGGPVELVEIVPDQAELLAEAVRIGSDALGMTTGDAVVKVERSDELQQDLRRLLRARRLACLAHEAQPLLQALHGARPQREPEPGRRFVGEDE
jgi:hypothetical protein